MEKQSSISSSKFIGATLENIIINSDISLSKMKEINNSLDKAAKAIIIPILKIQKKIESKFNLLEKDHNQKKDNFNKESNLNINAFIDESRSDSIHTETKSNKKNINNLDNMVSIYENISNNLDIFNKLLKSTEYDNLIKGFDKIIPDSEIFMPKEKENEKNKEKENKEKDNKDNNRENNKEKGNNEEKGREKNKEKNSKVNNRSKKNKKSNKKNIRKSNKKTTGSKDKKSIATQPKKKKKDRDLLEVLQKEYPSNNYVQKISKTFLSRRLFKNVIYRHIFYYRPNNEIEENKLRSSGESTVYKYGKFIFKFANDELNSTGKLDEFVGKELKQQFAKIDKENKQYIIAGKIGCLINEFIDKIFKLDLLRDFGICQATLEFYEFYEELVSEFNEKENNVRIIFCDEKILKNLREDWKNLEMVRGFVNKTKNDNTSLG